MPFPDPLATVFVVYGSDLKGPFVIVLHYFQVGTFGGSTALATALASAVDGTCGTTLRACISEDCEYVRTIANINADGVVYQGQVNDGAGPGTVSGQSLPDYAAAVIRKRTDVGGKVGRGRWYIGCVPEAFNDTGRVELGALSDYADLGTSLKDDVVVGGNTWRSGHMSRLAQTVVPIVEISVNPNFGTRRKRLLRSL